MSQSGRPSPPGPPHGAESISNFGPVRHQFNSNNRSSGYPYAYLNAPAPNPQSMPVPANYGTSYVSGNGSGYWASPGSRFTSPQGNYPPMYQQLGGYQQPYSTNPYPPNYQQNVPYPPYQSQYQQQPYFNNTRPVAPSGGRGGYHNQSNSNQYNRNNFQKKQNNSNSNSNRNQQAKEDAFYCEMCDRGFNKEDKYMEHCATHKTCGVNGCKFRAAEKLVQIHFKNFHASGIDKKLGSLQTPEEIQKYREERAKNFPTSVNMANKRKLESEMTSRGAILTNQQFGRLNKKKRPENNHQEGSNATNKSTNSSDSLDEEGEVASSQSQSPEAITAQQTEHNKAKNKNNSRNKRNNKNAMRKRNAEAKQVKRNQPTLLQKLLVDEIRHERNIILQCIRYVVQNNFFDEEKQPKPNVTVETEAKVDSEVKHAPSSPDTSSHSPLSASLVTRTE